jgi:hypothetical protein
MVRDAESGASLPLLAVALSVKFHTIRGNRLMPHICRTSAAVGGIGFSAGMLTSTLSAASPPAPGVAVNSHKRPARPATCRLRPVRDQPGKCPGANRPSVRHPSGIQRLCQPVQLSLPTSPNRCCASSRLAITSRSRCWAATRRKTAAPRYASSCRRPSACASTPRASNCSASKAPTCSSGKARRTRSKVTIRSVGTTSRQGPHAVRSLQLRAAVGDFDLHLFGEGRHWHAYRFLGAHQRTVDGIVGFQFAVWAPSATRVSVVGDFNQWDGRVHPMRVRGGSGVWELFIPGLERGSCTSSRCAIRPATRARSRSTPTPTPSRSARTTPHPAPPVTSAGATKTGSSAAPSATGSRAPCRSTRCTWAPGSATRTATS